MTYACVQSSMFCNALSLAYQSSISSMQLISNSTTPNACDDTASPDTFCREAKDQSIFVKCLGGKNTPGAKDDVMGVGFFPAMFIETEKGAVLPVKHFVEGKRHGVILTKEALAIRQRPSYESPHWITEQIMRQDSSFIPEPLAAPEDYDRSRTFRVNLERIIETKNRWGLHGVRYRSPSPGSIHIMMQELQHIPGIREHFLDADGSLNDTAVDYRRSMVDALAKVDALDLNYMMQTLNAQAPYWDMFLTTEKASIVKVVHEEMQVQRRYALFAGVSWGHNPEAVDFVRSVIVKHASSVLEPYRRELADDIESSLAEYECAAELARRAKISKDLFFPSVHSKVVSDRQSILREKYLSARAIAMGDYDFVAQRYGLKVVKPDRFCNELNFRGKIQLQDGSECDVDTNMTVPKKPHPLDTIFMLVAMREECGLEALRDIHIELATYLGYIDQGLQDRFVNPEVL